MTEHHDDQTMPKVLAALHRAGITKGLAEDAVLSMQDAGILFREREQSPVERVTAFLDRWEAVESYGDKIYTLGRMDGDYDLTVTDLRALIAEVSTR